MTNAERQKEYRQRARTRGIERWQVMVTDKEKKLLEIYLAKIRKKDN